MADEEEKKLEHCKSKSKASESGGFPAEDDARVSISTDTNFDHFRMETAWAQAEADHLRKNNPLAQSPQERDSCHTSPLMASSDSIERPTCLCTNDLNKTNNVQSKQCDDANEIAIAQRSAIKPSLLQRYRNFLQNHEPSLDILERIMERFVFYRYLFNHDHSGMRIELYYASWNIIRWVNDVVLMGWGEGMGMTIGTRNEFFDSSNKLSSEEKRSFQHWVLTKMHLMVPVLRAILTATTCVYPALEAWSRRPVRSRPLIRGTALPINESRQQEDWEYSSTTDLSPRTRRLQWEKRQSRAANLSYSVERIRFVSRLALLSISWWTRCRRKQLQKVEASAAPSLLRRGGELDPCEELLPFQASDMAAAVSQYKGKRTGRRSVSSTSTAAPSQSSTSTFKQPTFVRYVSNLVAGKHNILYFHVIGELLHILRPLYWSRSESIDWKHKAAHNHEHLTAPRRGSFFSISLWKAWLLSLIMDIVSDEILDITTGCKTYQTSERNIQQHSLLSRSTGRNAPYSPVSSVIESEHDELKWRRGRRSMYLLRSPAYKAITLPLMSAVTRLISKVPSFGLSRWASEYILDMTSYWNEHRFMLE